MANSEALPSKMDNFGARRAPPDNDVIGSPRILAAERRLVSRRYAISPGAPSRGKPNGFGKAFLRAFANLPRCSARATSRRLALKRLRTGEFLEGSHHGVVGGVREFGLWRPPRLRVEGRGPLARLASVGHQPFAAAELAQVKAVFPVDLVADEAAGVLAVIGPQIVAHAIAEALATPGPKPLHAASLHFSAPRKKAAPFGYFGCLPRLWPHFRVATMAAASSVKRI